MQLMLEICKKFPLRSRLHAFSASRLLIDIAFYDQLQEATVWMLNKPRIGLIVSYAVYKCSFIQSQRLAMHSAVIAIQKASLY